MNLMLKISNMKKSVAFCNGEWSAQGIEQFIQQNIKLWEIQYLDASKNHEPTILQQIQHISFPELISLDLSGNNIQTLQKLFLLKMPVLQSLHLGQNELSHLKGFKKTNFKELMMVDLDKNKIVSFEKFSEIHLPQIEKIVFETTPKYEQENRTFKLQYNEVPLVKLETHEKQIEINGNFKTMDVERKDLQKAKIKSKTVFKKHVIEYCNVQ